MKFDSEGHLWLTIDAMGRVVSLDQDGNKAGAFGELGQAPGQLHFPCAVDLDDAGNVYVFDCGTNRIQVFNRSHEMIGAWHTEGPHPVSGAFAIGPDGRMYAVGQNDTLLVIDVALPTD